MKKAVFMSAFTLTVFVLLTAGKCSKSSSTTTRKVRVLFRDQVSRMATGCQHPQIYYGFSSANIAGGGFGNPQGLISNGAGSPIPSSARCRLNTICKQTVKDTWSGWLEVTSGGRSLGFKEMADITTADFSNTSLLVGVPDNGSEVTLTVQLREPCFNVINNSALRALNNANRECIPTPLNRGRGVWRGQLNISKGNDTVELFLDGTSSAFSVPNECN